jgi:type IV pilus assembly protein PilC
MKSEELGFFNRQLAGMLRAGIPLEGGLKKLCETLPSSVTRDTLLALERDLSAGTPLAEALKKHELPELYKRMLVAGAASGDLPGTLILFADYCSQRDTLSRRLRGLLTYPLIVLTIAVAVSCLMAIFFHAVSSSSREIFNDFSLAPVSALRGVVQSVWITPVLILIIWIVFVMIAFVPLVRRRWQWFVPGLRETCLAQVASLIRVQLQSGVPLDDALKTVEIVEQGTPVAAELGAWRQHLAGGGGDIPAAFLKNQSIPPLFRWMVRQSGENLAEGFGHTESFYAERSTYRSELFLYAALPISVLVLGFVILGQFLPIFGLLSRVMSALGDAGG